MRPARAIASALTTALAIAGCTVGPDYHRPALQSPPTYAEAQPTGRTAVDSAPADLTAWWTVFHDPTLDELIRRALADNPDLQTAASRVREAREETKVARAAGLPSVNANSSAGTFNSDRGPPAPGRGGVGLILPAHTNLYSVGFDATWEIDLFGGVRRSVEAAKASEEAAEWARRDTQVTLLAEVANDYLTLRALQARIAIGQHELDRQRGEFELIHARRQNGFVTNLDVNQQTVQVETAAAAIPQLSAEAKVQMHALGVLLGQPPEALAGMLEPTAALPPPPPRLPVGLPSDLLLRRPDIREAERRLAAANAQIGVETANLYPKLDLIGLAAFASPTVSELFANKNLSSLALGVVQENLFNGGRTRAQIHVAEEEHVQAFQAYRTAVLTGFKEVEDALARFKADDERRASLVRSVTAAQNSLGIAQDQYRVGLVSFINVLQSENALLASQDQLTQSDAQVATDLVSLYKALGGGWSTEASP